MALVFIWNSSPIIIIIIIITMIIIIIIAQGFHFNLSLLIF